MTASAGMIAGDNPIRDGLGLFLVQSVFVIVLCRVLGVGLARLRQPRVIAEVIGGIILGPSVLGRAPGFSNFMFPQESMGPLTLVANIGLILFMFLVGLELDLSVFASSAKKSAAVSLAGIAVPFGSSIAVTHLLYWNMNNTDVPFHSFFLFLGVAMSITAFPVLARILTEQSLLQTEVGMQVIAAAAFDDAVSWSMLALVMVLINNGSNYLIALWVFLVTIGYVIFLLVVARRGFIWMIRHCERANSHTVSELSVCVTFVCVFASALMTEAIGVHAIFGAFLLGLIIPHESGFAIKLAEKIEDLVTIVFLPLYFASSGLKTQVGLLDTPFDWGLVCLVIAVATFGKLIGSSLVCKFWTGMGWRESLTVGVLMNTKGLVELIILNLGLDAGVISPKIFAIMVIMCLFTTLITSPVVAYIYPPKYHRQPKGYVNKRAVKLAPAHPETTGQHATPAAGGVQSAQPEGGDSPRKIRHMASNLVLADSLYDEWRGLTGRAAEKAAQAALRSSGGQQSVDATETNILLCLDNMQTVPLMMSLTQMLDIPQRKALKLHALRLIELDSRASSLMMATDGHTLTYDPVMSVFRTFGQLNRVGVNSLVAVAPANEFADQTAHAAMEVSANLIVLAIPAELPGERRLPPTQRDDSEGGWLSAFHHSGRLNTRHNSLIPNGSVSSVLTLDGQFERGFASKLLQQAPCSVAVFADRGFGVAASAAPLAIPEDTLSEDTPTATGIRRPSVSLPPGSLSMMPLKQMVLVPFFGGEDDREALAFAMQFAANCGLELHVLRVVPEGAVKRLGQRVRRMSTAESGDSQGTPQKEGGKPLETGDIEAALPGPAEEEEDALKDEKVVAAFKAFTGRVGRPEALVYSEVQSGEPANAVVARASKMCGKKDLVVCGRHNGGLSEEQQGTLREWLERSAKCSVCVVQCHPDKCM